MNTRNEQSKVKNIHVLQVNTNSQSTITTHFKHTVNEIKRNIERKNSKFTLIKQAEAYVYNMISDELYT